MMDEILLMSAGIVFVTIFAIVLFFVFLYILSIDKSKYIYPKDIDETEQRRAGKIGELNGISFIKSALKKDDYLFSNVTVIHDNREAELDNVIVNKHGVFIIEVKNYSGELYGLEDDYEWDKINTTAYGNSYCKKVKNPIIQVKRQVYILAKYLKYNGIEVCVEGYVLLMNFNSPTDDETIIYDKENLYNLIHPHHNCLKPETISKINRLFS